MRAVLRRRPLRPAPSHAQSGNNGSGRRWKLTAASEPSVVSPPQHSSDWLAPDGVLRPSSQVPLPPSPAAGDDEASTDDAEANADADEDWDADEASEDAEDEASEQDVAEQARAETPPVRSTRQRTATPTPTPIPKSPQQTQASRLQQKVSRMLPAAAACEPSCRRSNCSSECSQVLLPRCVRAGQRAMLHRAADALDLTHDSSGDVWSRRLALGHRGATRTVDLAAAAPAAGGLGNTALVQLLQMHLGVDVSMFLIHPGKRERPADASATRDEAAAGAADTQVRSGRPQRRQRRQVCCDRDLTPGRRPAGCVQVDEAARKRAKIDAEVAAVLREEAQAAKAVKEAASAAAEASAAACDGQAEELELKRKQLKEAIEQLDASIAQERALAQQHRAVAAALL